MLNLVQGNIFESDANIICHQTNCLGIMGGGIALQVRNLYPQVYEEYKRLCNAHKNNRETLLGRVQFCKIGNDKYIANCFGQNDIAQYSIATDYDALKKCFEKVLEQAEEYNLSVAVPYKIGCGLAGGDWNVVYNMLTELFEESNINCTIYQI